MDLFFAFCDIQDLSVPAPDRLFLSTFHSLTCKKQSDYNAENHCVQASPGIFMNNRRTLSPESGKPSAALLHALLTPQDQINEQVDLTLTHK